LSESLEISKVSLYKLLKRDEIKNHVFKKDGLTLVSEMGENLLRAYYSSERDEAFGGAFSQSVNSSVSQLNDETLLLLQDQLKEKDNQINALLNIVANSQKLQATQYITDKQAIIDPADKPKRSFWQKTFGRS